MNPPLPPFIPKILIVDDEEALRTMLCTGVERSGMTCHTADCAATALEFLAHNKVDVVITDVIMPGMNGIQLCETIKKTYETDVMVMTGYSDYAYELILERGASDFMPKPLRIPEFIARIRRVLAERAVHRERDQALLQVQDTLHKYRRAVDGVVHAMSVAVELKDPYTAGHQQRVAKIACEIAAVLSLTEDEISGLRIAATIHDLGKITIPSEILCKPGKLDPLEYEMLKRHVDMGYNILQNVDFPWPVADFVRQHHERLDGSGYPRGLKGDEILKEARIIAVADVFETMTSHRPYRPARGPGVALEEMLGGKGTLYDAEAVDALLTVYPEGARKSSPTI
jgi:response regulator RpfG family c-di-GMP phosphodiesterase